MQKALLFFRSALYLYRSFKSGQDVYLSSLWYRNVENNEKASESLYILHIFHRVFRKYRSQTNGDFHSLNIDFHIDFNFVIL